MKTAVRIFVVLMVAYALVEWASTDISPCAGISGEQTVAAVPPYVPGEVLVKLQEGVNESRRDELLEVAGAGAATRELYPQSRLVLTGLENGVSVEDAVAELKSHREIEYAEPNYFRFPQYVPDDPCFDMQWSLSNTGQSANGTVGTPGADIGAVAAWDMERGMTSPVTVAVLDSGIDFNHPDLDGSIWTNADEVADNGIDDDGNGFVDDVHGYNFAGISQTLFFNESTYIPLYRDLGTSASTRMYAQSIKGTGYDISHVGVLLSKQGDPSGDITVSLRTALGGPDLGSFTISPDEIAGPRDLIYGELSSSYHLASGATCYLVFKTDNLSSSDYYSIYQAMNTYVEGQQWLWDGALWTASATYDFYFKTDPNPFPRDDRGHGTLVSGVIAAESDNAVGISGISRGAKIMPVKVLSSGGVKAGTSDIAELIAGLYYAADNGARVANISCGSPSFSQAEQDAVDYARAKGMLICAAVGNEGSDLAIYPACCENVVGCAATTNTDTIASFSNHHGLVDISAPGKDIYVTRLGGGYTYGSGTSLATPHVAGLAALVFSIRPGYDDEQVEQAILANARDLGDPGRDDFFGNGRLDAYATLRSMGYTFYFAEGYTGAGFQEYLCLGQTGDSPLQVKATYLFPDEPPLEKAYTLPPRSRLTLDVNTEVGEGKEVSVKCEADRPFACERPMYFNYGGVWTGGHDVVGAGTQSNTWYFAEGYTGPGFDEWICVLNSGDTAARLSFCFQTQEAGEIKIDGLTVPARCRRSFKVNEMLDGYYQASLKLEASSPVVAERPMYFVYQGSGGLDWTGGHCVVGSPALGRKYFFAEGTTRGGFEQWLCIQNPSPVAITVNATYLMQDGNGVERSYDVGAGRRHTVFIPAEVGMGQDVSLQLSSSSDFLAERPMYFRYRSMGEYDWTGGHCVIGTSSASRCWFFVEGATIDGFEQWLCIQNPGDVEANVTVTYYPEGSEDPRFSQHVVAPHSRYTIMVNSDAAEKRPISTLMCSDQPIIAERPMYFAFRGEWTGGHDAFGYKYVQP